MTDFRDYLNHLYEDAIESEGQARKRQKNALASAETAAAVALVHQRHKELLYEALKIFDEQELQDDTTPALSAACQVCQDTGVERWNTHNTGGVRICSCKLTHP